MVSNDDFDGKATHFNCFYLQINFEQKYPKPAIVQGRNQPLYERHVTKPGRNRVKPSTCFKLYFFSFEKPSACWRSQPASKLS